MKSDKQHVYIIGSKGIPAKYGGFETFVDKLTENKKKSNIEYHVSCMEENSKKSGIEGKHFIYNGVECFNIAVPNIGPAKAIYYDIKSLEYAIKLAEKGKDKTPIFYVLACRIGPFISKYKKKISKLGGKLYVNPDGHEWLREKWNYPIRKYWKYSEKLMVKHADLLICDSKNIKAYISKEYQKYSPKTTYIAYGTDLSMTEYNSNTEEVLEWFKEKQIKEGEYYLVVGRFVPENNYEVMLKEYMKTKSKKDFVLVTNIEENKFYEKLKNDTGFDVDKRIKFVGTVYNQNLLKYIRENAYAYIHGHEVGGTNPSLLESLASTKLNLLLDVGFNREVGEDQVLYWDKEKKKLHKLIDSIQNENFSLTPRKIVEKKYNWSFIVDEYEEQFDQKEK